jgi:hypothetical protein
MVLLPGGWKQYVKYVSVPKHIMEANRRKGGNTIYSVRHYIQIVVSFTLWQIYPGKIPLQFDVLQSRPRCGDGQERLCVCHDSVLPDRSVYHIAFNTKNKLMKTSPNVTDCLVRWIPIRSWVCPYRWYLWIQRCVSESGNMRWMTSDSRSYSQPLLSPWEVRYIADTASPLPTAAI